MSLAPGTRLGPYEISTPLGAGGMGEVYRARDPRLGRDVAIKVLPLALTANAESRARFEREARTISSLNHPHICTIHDVGREGDTDYLVLELIEGETLAARLARGSLPTGDVLKFGAQIADALDRAHRAGVIHRDLKPGNVMLTKSGAKLMDFGLARATGLAGPASGSATMAPSPTIAGPLTAEGTVVGTFQYMAPEQLEGKEADARGDLWSFGCVLYEMATGKAAFSGSTQASLISAIMRDVPRPMAERVPTSPPALDRLVGALLAKDPDERLQTAHDAKLQLQWAGDAGSSASSTVAPAPGGFAAVRRGRGALLPALAVGLALVAAAAWFLPLGRTFGRGEGRVRLTIQPPAGIVVADNATSAVISPDGRMIVFVGSDSSASARLWLRDLGSLEARPIEGTEHGLQPFWAPDSRGLGFFADGKMKKLAIAGGKPEILCDAPDPRGGTWGSRGTIVFAPLATGGLFSIAAEGGKVTELVLPDSSRHETALRFPCFLPDGRRYLFVTLPRRDGAFDVQLGELGSRKPRSIAHAGASPVYTEPGYLITARGARMTAERFDARAGKVTGQPFTIGEAPVGVPNDGAPIASASRGGVLAYSSGSLINSRLEWWDRAGRIVGALPLPGGSWSTPLISPDGRQALVLRATSMFELDLWRLDLGTGESTRITFVPTQLQGGFAWSPDGNRVVCNMTPKGPGDLFIQSVNGGEPELLYESDVVFKNPASWSPDGKFITFYQPDAKTGWDVWAIPVDGERKPIPLVRTPANEGGGWISPDGRWVAYNSDESGRSELYVQSFPGPSGRTRVSGSASSSTNPGVCWWSRDSREFLFVTGTSLRAVPIGSGAALEIGPWRPLFDLPAVNLGMAATPDHERFLVAVPDGIVATPAVVIDMNWASAARQP